MLERFSCETGSVQYYAALAITGAISCSSREKLYQELRLVHMHHRCEMRHLCFFYKVLSNKVPKYIYDLVLPIRHSFTHRNSFSDYPCRTEYFKNSFLCVCYKLLEQTQVQNL